MLKILSATGLSCIALMAGAEVTSKGDNGFNLTIIGEAPVPVSEAYEQFINVADWWLASHTWFGDAAGLSINPRAGGCFCEKSTARPEGESAGGEVLHMLVTFVKPPHQGNAEIRMVGGLGPLQMAGLHGGMSWSFRTLDTGHTQITQTYNVTGYMEGGTSQLAEVVDRVQTSQLDALIRRLSSK